MSKDIVFVTTATAAHGKEEEVQHALINVAEAARQSSGCIDYQILQSTDDVATTINVEHWESRKARDTFNNGPAVADFVAAVSGKFATSPQPFSYNRVG